MWYRCAAHESPTCSSKRIDRFVKEDLYRLRHQSKVRIVGTPENARLICRMSSCVDTMICSPGLCVTHKERDDPDIVLRQVQYVCGAPSLGGWHPVTDTDIKTYQLIQSMQWHRQRGQLTASRSLLRMLRRHPAWAALSFPAGGDALAQMKLIEMIVDPRWYINPTAPNSQRKLHAYLGLVPNCISQVLGAPRGKQTCDPRYAERSATVLAASGLLQSSRTPKETTSTEPNGFLRRIAEGPNKILRLLRACKIYTSFVTAVWLDTITATPDGLFDPAQVFRGEAELSAFSKHRLRNAYR